MIFLFAPKVQVNHSLLIETSYRHFEAPCIRKKVKQNGTPNIFNFLSEFPTIIQVEVFKFEDDKVISIQNLSTWDPLGMDTFTYSNEKHVVVYEKNRNSTIFRWNGNIMNF